MPCYFPLPATRLSGGGKIVVHKRHADRKPTPQHLGHDFKLPCANCIGCRLDRSKAWAIRLMNEAQLHERNSFLTLTYNDETLGRRRPTWEPTVPYTPPSRVASPNNHALPIRAHAKTHAHEDSLYPRDTQLFMKRLRSSLAAQNPSTKVRYYLVGEYGDKYKRPHYHVALFGEDFSDDRYAWRTTDNGDICYRSSRLEKAWPHGNSEIGELTIDSAAYIAGYILKKINGGKACEHYKREAWDGSNYWLEPEFARMSRGGRNGRGIAYDWFQKYHADVTAHDAVLHKGRKMKPPRYYDKLLEAIDPVKLAVQRLMREHRAKQLADDNTPARLQDKEIVATARQKLKRKSLER